MQPVRDRETIIESTFHTYLDESGNTGRNHLDPDQPFFVLGGWIVTLEILPTCRARLLEWEKTVGRGGQEVKASKVLQRRGGLEEVLKLMRALLEGGASPTACVFEKRFGICMNLVETFFPGDPVSEVGGLPLPDAARRRHAANVVIENISDDLLKAFAAAMYGRDIKALEMVRQQFAGELVAHGAEELAEAIMTIPLEDQAVFPFCGDNAVNSINSTVFHTQLMLLEHFCRRGQFGAWRLYHDETASFQEILTQTVAHFEAMPPAEHNQTNGLTLYFGKLRLEEMKFLQSHDEPMVRAADHYAGFLCHLFKNLPAAADVVTQEAVLVAQLLNSTRLKLPPLQYYTLSPRMHAEVDRLEKAAG